MFLLISVEGNIGSGKTTLVNRLRQLDEAAHIHFIADHVQQLRESGWMCKFYDDKAKHAFPLQMTMLMKRWNSLLELFLKHTASANSEECFIVVTERSMYSDSKVFTSALHSMGYIDERELNIIQEAYTGYTAALKLLRFKEVGFLYIESHPQDCYQIHCKSAPAEETLDQKYLSVLHSVHGTMLNCRKLPHFVLHQNCSDEELQQVVEWMLQLR